MIRPFGSERTDLVHQGACLGHGGISDTVDAASEVGHTFDAGDAVDAAGASDDAEGDDAYRLCY